MNPARIAERPAHVGAGLVREFDFYADRRYHAAQDIHCALHAMGEAEGRGIFWTPANGGHWFITDHAMLFSAMRDTDLFSSAAQNLPPMPEGQEPRVLPVSLDGEEHAAYRLPLLKAFSPGAVRAIEPEIRSYAIELIEAVRGRDSFDFVSGIAEPYPVAIFMKFMGLDVARLAEFRIWVADMLSSGDERRAASHAKILGMLNDLIAQRRSQPQDDLVSRLIASEVRGEPITQDDLLGFCLLLFGAGLDTVANAMAFGIQYLARRPDLQQRLRDDGRLVDAAVEELLRLHGIANVVRIVTRDCRWNGVDLKHGDRVLMVLAGGNLDPKVYPAPMDLDLEREGEPHVTFGIGPHRCAGAYLARLELRIFFAEWFARMPTVRLDPERPAKPRGGQTLGLDALPLVTG